MPALAAAYRPRRPTETVLYALVGEHLETFLAHTRETYGAPLPRYVEDEFRQYLRCGVFAHGFVRAHCDACGHDLLVAFSCKLRGLCPSCAGRRMANTAAHLVDRVLPAVPVRQWVLSLPFELRSLVAFDAKVLSALGRIFAGAVEAFYRISAKRAGVDAPQTGAVTFVQRFGGSLNLNVHFHVVFLDGVFAPETDGRLLFHSALPPRPEELARIVQSVHRRALRWLRRHGRLESTSIEERSNEAASPSPIEACAEIATQRGTTRSLAEDAGARAEAEELVRQGAATESPVREDAAVEHAGFNLHASVRIAAEDDRSRERLCRYGARPPFSLERMRRLPGGRVAYRIKKLGRGRAKHRVMTPLELLARLAALVPPPRYPLVRYHGVLAPRSAWRRAIVPRPPTDAPKKAACSPTRTEPAAVNRQDAGVLQGQSPKAPRPPVEEGRRPAAAEAGAGAGGCASTLVRPSAADRVLRDVDVQPLAPNVLRIRHWSRLMDGLLYATAPRLPWSQLLRRTFDVDVMECSACKSRLRIVEVVTAADAARQILERLGLPTAPPRLARARDPTTLDGDAPDVS